MSDVKFLSPTLLLASLFRNLGAIVLPFFVKRRDIVNQEAVTNKAGDR